VNVRRLVPFGTDRPLLLLSLEDVTARHLTDALRRARVDALSADARSKDEFLAMLAHELRNPLAPMRTAAELLASPRASAAATQRARAVIERQVQTMTHLIEDFLDVARITHGKLEIRRAPVDLVAVVRRASELVAADMTSRSQRLSLVLPSEAVYVFGDRIRLEQAVGNLLNNASQFTRHDGEISLCVTVGAPDASMVTVRITDNGVGIAKETLPHVFDLFRQGDASPHRSGGLGVGLALVRRIVTLHGGHVGVTNEGCDRGTQFSVSLPLIDAVSSAPSETAPEPASEPSGRVLMVDDNVDAAESLAACSPCGATTCAWPTTVPRRSRWRRPSSPTPRSSTSAWTASRWRATSGQCRRAPE